MPPCLPDLQMCLEHGIPHLTSLRKAGVVLQEAILARELHHACDPLWEGTEESVKDIPLSNAQKRVLAMLPIVGRELAKLMMVAPIMPGAEG